jgi:hypothetical protein
VPEAVVQQYLQLGGAFTDDPRILKLVALATDKFLAGVVKDTKELGALRVGEKRAPPPLDMQVFLASTWLATAMKVAQREKRPRKHFCGEEVDHCPDPLAPLLSERRTLPKASGQEG